MEFKAQKKKLKVTIEGQVYEMTCPSVFQTEELNESLKNCEPGRSYHVYADLFEKLGLPKEVLMSMDADDFLDFVTFVLSPKKKILKTET